MKKYFKVLFLVLFLALSFVFVGCGGNDTELSDKERNNFIEEIGGASETFIGEISDMAFTSKDAAVNGFLSLEITGHSPAKVHEVNTKAVLDEEAINKLDIPAEDKEGIVEVEEVEVTYEETSFRYSSKDGDNEVKKVTWIANYTSLNNNVLPIYHYLDDMTNMRFGATLYCVKKGA
jgi:hypothetical protein